MAAFYDDSGAFNPEGRKFACWGMVVVPTQYIRECNDAWWKMLDGHFQCGSTIQTHGIEAKSTELESMLTKLKANRNSLNDHQEKMYEYGLNTTERVSKLIKEIWEFLGTPPTAAKYLAVIADKGEVWQSFRPEQFNQWRILKQQGREERERGYKERMKKLASELESFLIRHTYEYLLQRLHYSHSDSDFQFNDCFVVGDESSSSKLILETQAGIQAGLGKFSELETIVNKSWFGSSLHDPCLQIADWIAYAVRIWAERSSPRIKLLLPHFRGYPVLDNIIGRGIVLCPKKECFPNLELKDNIEVEHEY